MEYPGQPCACAGMTEWSIIELRHRKRLPLVCSMRTERACKRPKLVMPVNKVLSCFASPYPYTDALLSFLRISIYKKHAERQGGSQTVDPVENSAVSGQQITAVFYAGLPLEHRLEQIADDAHDGQTDKQRLEP